MSFVHGSRRLWGAALTGAAALWVLAFSGCGSSTLKTRSPDGGQDAPGFALADSGPGTGGAVATGGAMVTGGAVGTGGVLGTAGAVTTGGTIGTGGTGTIHWDGGAPGRGGFPGTAGTGFGGSPRNGGSTGVRFGGVTGRGGTVMGGTFSTGGRTGTGGGPFSTGGTGIGTGGIGGAGGSTGSAMFQPLINAFCAAAKKCCGLKSYPAADLADCEAKFPSRLQIYPLADRGTISVDQTALAACVAAYNTAATTCTMTGVEAACEAISVGTQVEGQACGGASKFGAYECKPLNGTASCYRQQSGASTGVCISIPRGKSGDECSMTCLKDETCLVDMVGGTAPFPVSCFEEDGLYCSVSSNPAICKPILQLGDQCSWDRNSCGRGNFCGWSTPNTCQIAAKLGESCSNAYCVDGLECGSNGRCVEVPFASEDVCKGIPSLP